MHDSGLILANGRLTIFFDHVTNFSKDMAENPFHKYFDGELNFEGNVIDITSVVYSHVFQVI